MTLYIHTCAYTKSELSRWEYIYIYIYILYAGKDGDIKARLDPDEADTIAALSPDGLSIQTREPKQWGGARCNVGMRPEGRWYFEVTIEDEGLCRLGVGTSDATRNLGTDNQGLVV